MFYGSIFIGPWLWKWRQNTWLSLKKAESPWRWTLQCTPPHFLCLRVHATPGACLRVYCAWARSTPGTFLRHLVHKRSVWNGYINGNTTADGKVKKIRVLKKRNPWKGVFFFNTLVGKKPAGVEQRGKHERLAPHLPQSRNFKWPPDFFPICLQFRLVRWLLGYATLVVDEEKETNPVF